MKIQLQLKNICKSKAVICSTLLDLLIKFILRCAILIGSQHLVASNCYLHHHYMHHFWEISKWKYKRF